MHILVAAKQVLDPDGINSYALWGRLEVSEDGRGFNTGETVPRIINAYDEQAMEAVHPNKLALMQIHSPSFERRSYPPLGQCSSLNRSVLRSCPCLPLPELRSIQLV